jgi:hypothetical protein
MSKIKEDANKMLQHIREALMIDQHWTIEISDDPEITTNGQISLNTRYKKGEIGINFQNIKKSSELFDVIRHEVIHVLLSGMDSMDYYVDELSSGRAQKLIRKVSYDLNEHILLHLEHLFDKNNLCCYDGYSSEEVTYANEETREKGSGEEATQEGRKEAN